MVNYLNERYLFWGAELDYDPVTNENLQTRLFQTAFQGRFVAMEPYFRHDGEGDFVGLEMKEMGEQADLQPRIYGENAKRIVDRYGGSHFNLNPYMGASIRKVLFRREESPANERPVEISVHEYLLRGKPMKAINLRTTKVVHCSRIEKEVKVSE